ncbi:MAG: hypothetical protein R2838_09255 [Caldilineaceae bacterium]
MRGNIVMMGYLKNEAATETALRRRLVPLRRSGHAHPDGYIELKDRAKDIIISGGENISTIEVENAFRHPVMDCAGGRPDPTWGETPCAFVQLRLDAQDVTAEELIAFCRNEIARFQSAAPCDLSRPTAQDVYREDAEVRAAHARG